MRSTKHRVVIVAVVVGVLIVPAIIWSGKLTRDPNVKHPEVSTVGPAMTPYVMTPGEIEKLSLPVTIHQTPAEYQQSMATPMTFQNEGEYPGMTPAELEKLARFRAMGPTTSPVSLDEKKEPFSTIIIVPRAPGIEGMTPQERAKLEAHLKNKK